MHLILSKTEKKAYYLFDMREYVVGRKDTDILIKDDTSISRRHASLSIKNGKMYITDLGAKYNTFINGVQLKANDPTELNIDQEIKFGILNSVYIVKEDKLNVTTSGLTGDERKVLSRVLKRLDGNISSNWSKDCCYLTVREIMLTLKVLCALIEKQPIVTMSFWTDYIKNVNEGLPPPDPKNYKASYAEIMLHKNVNFDEDCCRRTLFQNKIFIFKNKISKAKIEIIVELAGGTCFHWNQKPFTKEHFSSSNPQYLLIRDDGEVSDEDESFVKMINYLRSIGKRPIPFQEIAMAVVLATCVKECNPDFDRAGTLIKENEEQIIFTSDILALETQTQNLGVENRSLVVPETIADPDTLTSTISDKGKAQELNNNKRRRMEDKEESQTYTNIFGTGSGQPKCIATSTQKENADANSLQSSSTSNDMKELALNEKRNSLKREGQEINGNGKRKRLENNFMELDKWVTTTHKQTEIKTSNSIDLTLDDDVDKANSFIEKEVSISNNSKADDQFPFGFGRCVSKSKSKITTISRFLKPASPSTSDADVSIIDLDSPSTSGKRRLDISPAGPSKKKALLENPFSSKIKIEKSISPFQKNTSIKESRPTSSPFSMRGKKSEKTVKPDSEKTQENIAPRPYRFNIIIDVEGDRNLEWLEMSSASKSEVNTSRKNIPGFDESMQRFMESFRDFVITEKQNLVVERPVVRNNDATINNKKNFKKFKKIEPRHMQTIIIPNASYQDLNTEVRAH